MSRAENRSLIRMVVVAIAATAIAVAAGAGVASAHSAPAAHHALADNGLLHTD